MSLWAKLNGLVQHLQWETCLISRKPCMELQLSRNKGSIYSTLVSSDALLRSNTPGSSSGRKIVKYCHVTQHITHRIWKPESSSFLLLFSAAQLSTSVQASKSSRCLFLSFLSFFFFLSFLSWNTAHLRPLSAPAPHGNRRRERHSFQAHELTQQASFSLSFLSFLSFFFFFSFFSLAKVPCSLLGQSIARMPPQVHRPPKYIQQLQQPYFQPRYSRS